MKVGLYFGSFNPIHIGHLILANYMVQYADLDQIWFVISPHNPLKDKKTLLDDYHRLALVHEAIDSNDKFRASDVEFNLQQPNYTVKTLAVLKEKYPKHTFSLLMGEDNLRTLHKWYNFEYILENYQLFVYPRAYTVQEMRGEQVEKNGFEQHQNVHILADAPIMNISSSFIRKAIQEKKDITYLLPDNVLKYIDKMGFYL